MVPLANLQAGSLDCIHGTIELFSRIPMDERRESVHIHSVRLQTPFRHHHYPHTYPHTYPHSSALKSGVRVYDCLTSRASSLKDSRTSSP